MRRFMTHFNTAWNRIVTLFKGRTEQPGRIVPEINNPATVLPIKKVTESSCLQKGPNTPNPVTEVQEFLLKHYDFRINRLTGQTEFRMCSLPGGQAEGFRPVGKREMNSLCINAREAGIDCWDRDVCRYVGSAHIGTFHPFEQYMDGLPVWDGVERVELLARRVSGNDIWVDGFHRWMLALTAQWMGMDQVFANSVSPVLVSRRQGMHKSTFCKMLVPDSLQAYYTDSFDVTSVSGSEQKLATFGLINLDELDKFSPRKMAQLKNLMQMASLTLRKAYSNTYSSLPRIASFIATSNQMELLTDPTGSRRFLCIEVEQMIDCTPFCHEQLYAQLKQELNSGMRHWFTAEEETRMMEQNAPFRKISMEYDVFFAHFRRPADGETPLRLTSAEIFTRLKRYKPAAMLGSTPGNFGRVLMSLGIERVHTKKGNVFLVVEGEVGG